MKKNEIATKASTEMSVDLEAEFLNDSGAGMEEVDSTTTAIPFLSVLQGLSSAVSDGVEGARPGVILNSVTREVYKEIMIIPCAFQRRYLRWVPRSDGGGFKGMLMPSIVESGVVDGVKTHVYTDDKGKKTLMVGSDELHDTRQHFVLSQSHNGIWTPAIISLSNTSIKTSKNFIAQIQNIGINTVNGVIKPPSFSHIFKMSCKKEENKKGAWFMPEFALVGKVEDMSVYRQAKAFHAAINTGVDVNYEQPSNLF